jgi:lipid-binding SYLF domain-containing protein
MSNGAGSWNVRAIRARGAIVAGLVACGVAMGHTNLRAQAGSAQTKRIAEAAQVLREIHAVPDKDVPQELWDRAACVIVVPAMKKAAFVLGGEYGKGFMSCRHAGGWSAPVSMAVEKGSWGLQIGAQSIDLVLLVMNQGGMQKLLKNKVSLGAEASIAAGPVGRDARAATDAQLKAEILSYSRTQGLFAGINLSGGVVKPDDDDNADLYGKGISPESVVNGGTPAPAAAEPLMTALKRRL